jgi:xanthine/uracil/vitamin C permease (AzgA family)
MTSAYRQSIKNSSWCDNSIVKRLIAVAPLLLTIAVVAISAAVFARSAVAGGEPSWSIALAVLLLYGVSALILAFGAAAWAPTAGPRGAALLRPYI